MKKIWIALLTAWPLFASVQETLPTWHWVYDYIESMQTAGMFRDLYQSRQPYTRGEVAGSLLNTGYEIKEHKLALSEALLKRYKKLVQEFSVEIRCLQNKADSTGILELGGHVIQDIQQSPGEEVKMKGIYRSLVHVPLGNHFSFYNGINFDQYLVDDPDYTGKKWRGVAGYAEQAYMNAQFGRFHIKFGRDFLRWGAGQSGTLVFSNLTRPMDHLIVSADMGPFRYSYFISRLDNWVLSGSLADSLGGSWASRYVSAHRLDARFFHGKLQCAISELVTYGGVNRSPDWIYLNPFIFFHGASMNERLPANTFGSIDVLWNIRRNWQIWATLMIDDVQVEKTGPIDLEPNEIGYLLGAKWAPAPGTILWTEYVRVTNRTYKTIHPWETFVFRGVPLGYPQGNDFDAWHVGLTQWIGGCFRAEIRYTKTRKGEGSLLTPFDRPWMAYSVEEGYSEPFPTGIVEKADRFYLKMNYYASGAWGVSGEYGSSSYKNFQNAEGEKESQTYWKIGVWLSGRLAIRLE